MNKFFVDFIKTSAIIFSTFSKDKVQFNVKIEYTIGNYFDFVTLKRDAIVAQLSKLGVRKSDPANQDRIVGYGEI